MGSASISIAITSAFNGAAIDKAASSLSKLTSQLSRAEKMTAASAMSSTRDLAQWGNSAEQLGSKWQAAGKKMAAVGDSLTKAVTVPMVAVGAYASKMAVDFDTSMANLRKVSDMTADELEGFAQSALELSKVQPVDASTILNVEALGKQLGVSQGSLESFAKTVTGLDIATNMDAETAGTELARFANIVGMTEDEFSNYGSTLVNIGNTMATTESEVSQMAQRFASAGAQAGLSEAEILGMSGAMSSLGIKAEMGGSALSHVFVNISKQVANGGSKLEAFASAAGMSADEFSAAWRDNAADAFNALIEGIGRASAAGTDMNVIMAELGITQIRQSDVMRRLAGSTKAVTNQESILGSALANSRKAWEENTALQSEVDQRNESMASRLQVLKNRVDAIAITVGRPLVEALIDATDALSPVIDAVSNAAQAFADMDEEGQRNVLMWAAVAAGAGPALSVLGRGVQVLGSIAKGAGSAAQKLAVYTDAMSTADGNQLRTYASANSLSSQMGVTRNAAVKAAGGVENYMAAWDGMNLAAGKVKKSEAEIAKLMGQAQTATGKSRESIIKRGDALFAQIQAEKKSYESNAKLVAGWSGSSKEAEKAAYGVKSLCTSYQKVAKQLESGSVTSKTASAAFAAMKSESERASSSFSSKFAPALQTFGQKAKSAGLMALDLGKNIASMALQGAAIAAVTVAIGAVASAIMEWKQRQDDLAAASESFEDMQDRIAAKVGKASGAMGDYSLSVGEVAKACSDALKDTVALGDSIEESLTEVAVNSATLDSYVATIDALANKSNLSAAEQANLQAAVKGYNEITGDQISVVDAVNGKLKDQNDKLIESTGQLNVNAEAWKRNAQAQAAQDALTEAYKNQIEQQQTLAKAQDAYNKTLDELAGKDLTKLNFADAMKLEEAKKGLEDAQTALKGTNEQIEGLTAVAAVAGSKLSNDFISAVQSMPQSMQTVGVDIATNLQAGVESGAYLASDAAKFLTETVENAVSSLPAGMQEQGLAVATKLSAGVSSGQITLEQATTFMTSTVGSIVSAMPMDMQGKGLAAAQALAADLASGNVTVEQAASLLGAAANGGLESLPSDLAAKGNASVLSLNTAIAFGQTGALSASTGVKNSANQGISSLANDFANKSKDAVNGLNAGISSGATGALQSASSVKNSANQGVASLSSDFRGTGSKSGSSLSAALGSYAGSVKGNSSSLAAAANGGVSALPGQMGSTASGASRDFANGIYAYKHTAQANADAMAAASSRMNANFGSAYTWGSHMGSNFASGIRNAIGWVRVAASNIANAAKNILGFSVPVDGPFSGMEKGGETSGMHLAQNWAAGIERGIPMVRAASERMAMAARAELPAVARAVPASSAAAATAASQTTNYYTVNIDGRQLRNASPRAMEALSVLFGEFNLTSDMGVA